MCSSSTSLVKDYRQANKEYYDQQETNQTSAPHAIELARRSANAFRRVYEFDEDETVVMDFACGVGLVSQELIPYAKSIVGVDISQNMVDEYNRRAANQGLSRDEMQGIQADILHSHESTELRKTKESFDVIVCAASYHHFDDIIATTQALSIFLKPGGALLVIDLLKEEHLDIGELFPEHRGHQNIVAHRGGFTEAEIRTAFTSAGLTGFEFGDAIKAKKKGHPVTLFVARGRR